MDIEENNYYSCLLDFYGVLLTPMQLKVAQGFFYDNLGMTELSELNNTSRQSIYDLLKRIKDILKLFESKLMLKQKYFKSLTLLDNGDKKKEFIKIWEE